MKKINNTKEKNLFKCLSIIIAIFTIIAVGIKPLLDDLKFGLDLQGGFEILYQVESIDDKDVTNEMVTNTYKTISKRINGLGVSEPEIIVEGDRIRVQLAGVADGASARSTLSKVASLSFRDSKDKLLMSSDVLKGGAARVSTDESGRPAVSLSVKDKDQFYAVTKAISETEDKLIVIWLDYSELSDSYAKEGNNCGTDASNCLSAATVSQGFASDVIIQGDFTSEEVENLVNLINSGSLPTKLTEISSKTVSASFGADSLELTAKAGLIGIIIIMILLIVIYRFAGFVASLSIIIYSFLTILTFWLFGGVLTLPGIAALVIGIGMAIDSCVITFARIKDELSNNVRLEGAIKKGNHNSFSAIFDSNLTTLLVAFILFVFGESSVKGFATMLIISTIVTMIIMVLLTRSLLNLFVKSFDFENKLNFFIGYKKTKKEEKVINFVKIRKFAYAYLVIMVIVGIVSLFTNKLTLGIDFKGGSSIGISSEEKIKTNDIKKELEELGYTIYDTEEIDENNVTFKVNQSFKEDEVIEVEKTLKEDYNVNTQIGVVSNTVKKDLVKNAFMSVLFACLGIILYVSFRFKFSYAFTGILALVHDAFFMIVVFSIFKLEVSSIFIAAILSIIGYSINDTIVSFDRIRENLTNLKGGKVKDKEELANVVNKSLTQTLNRTIITTLTTLCPVIMLVTMGSNEIINFNIALLVGLVAGVLSSIFVAAPLWFDIEKNQIGKKTKKRWYEEDIKEPKEKKIKGINA